MVSPFYQMSEKKEERKKGKARAGHYLHIENFVDNWMSFVEGFIARGSLNSEQTNKDSSTNIAFKICLHSPVFQYFTVNTHSALCSGDVFFLDP
jgi:hypothetical protein